MNNIFYFFIIFFLISGCSLNKGSKFWTSSKSIKNEKDINYKEFFPEEEALKKEFNSELKIKLTSKTFTKISINNYLNNNNRLNFDGSLKKDSRYKFSKIKNFHQYKPEILFYNNDLIFFDNKGSGLRFNDKAKLVLKKNYYSKNQKKMNPILQFAKNEKYLIVADNIAKFYMLNIQNVNLIWSKKNLAPFNSQIKIYKDKFFIVDFTNTIRCFSIKDGSELWNIKTQNSLIRLNFL